MATPISFRAISSKQIKPDKICFCQESFRSLEGKSFNHVFTFDIHGVIFQLLQQRKSILESGSSANHAAKLDVLSLDPEEMEPEMRAFRCQDWTVNSVERGQFAFSVKKNIKWGKEKAAIKRYNYLVSFVLWCMFAFLMFAFNHIFIPNYFVSVVSFLLFSYLFLAVIVASYHHHHFPPVCNIVLSS